MVQHTPLTTALATIQPQYMSQSQSRAWPSNYWINPLTIDWFNQLKTYLIDQLRRWNTDYFDWLIGVEKLKCDSIGLDNTYYVDYAICFLQVLYLLWLSSLLDDVWSFLSPSLRAVSSFTYSPSSDIIRETTWNSTWNTSTKPENLCEIIG